MVQEKKQKIDFQDGRHLEFPIEIILAVFHLQITHYFLPSSESTGLLVQKKRKTDLQDGSHGGHLGYLMQRILAIFNLQVAPMLPTKFRVNWPRGVGGLGF